MLRPIRRIVTANDAQGKSEVLIDGIADHTITVLTELWQTGAVPHDHRLPEDLARRSQGIEPPPGGTVFRFFQIPPESQSDHLSWEERQRAGRDWFSAMGAAHLQPDTSRHESMHLSPTTDYIVLLSGQCTLILDKDERELKPFDVVIQRGTNHAWVNRGNEDALLLAVLVDATGNSRDQEYAK